MAVLAGGTACSSLAGVVVRLVLALLVGVDGCLELSCLLNSCLEAAVLISSALCYL